MSRARPALFGLVTLTATLTAAAQIPSSPSSPAFPSPPVLSSPVGRTPPPPPMPTPGAPPVEFFRELLALPPAERLASLTNRPPAARARIMAKVQEYLELDPDERELRLRATELRWYLTPLFRLTPAERAPQLARVPEDLRALVKARLVQWDILPPPLQREFLASDRPLLYFAHVETTNRAAGSPETQRISDQFNRFFDLTDAEKEQTLGSLSDAERAAMAKTLQAFEKLPPQLRVECVRNYAKFAGMSAADRAEFLQNAARWSQMSPAERQSWRDLVANVPQWPPLPPVLNLPPMPPMPRIQSSPAMATAAPNKSGVATN